MPRSKPWSSGVNRAIRELLPATTGEIAVQLGHPVQNVSAALCQMRKLGQVARSPAGVWSLRRTVLGLKPSASYRVEVCQ